jgi:PAS domain S-box-containing protein
MDGSTPTVAPGDVTPDVLLERAPAGIWVISPADQTLYANSALLGMLGASPSELLSTPARQFFHPSDSVATADLLSAGRGPLDATTLRLRRADGHTVRVVVTSSSWEPGSLRATVLAVTPTSSTMLGAEHVRERERQFRVAERLGHLGSWEWHVKTGQLTFSDELYHIFGIEPSVVGPTLASVVERTDPGDRDYFIGVIEQIAAGVRERPFERRIHRPNGEVRVLHSSTHVAESDEDGTAVRVVGVCRDVTTERRALERGRRFQELYEGERRVAERLRQLDELKFAFMSAVSHDLRSPLATVLGSAATLRDLGPSLDDATTRSLLDQTIEQAHHLDLMLADLLDLERLRRGANEGVFRPVALGELVRSTLADIHSGDRVTLDAATPDVVADVDPPKVERIVENLVRNALRASPARSPVHVGVCSADGVARIIVDDAGPGVPDHLKSKVFEPFASTEAADVASRSSLSLAIVGRYVRLHAGHAHVEDLPGGGSRAVVDLPRRQVSTAAPPASPVGDAAVAPTLDAHELRP